MISIAPYNPAWREEFFQMGGMLRKYLGDLAIRIDHVGSTAVPGLAAKDILDIQVTAAGLSPQLERTLNLCGFQRVLAITHDHVPPGRDADPQQWEKWIFKPEAGSAQGQPARAFARQAEPALRPALPRLLAPLPGCRAGLRPGENGVGSYHPEDDMDAYYDIKDPVCDIISAGAEFWAKATGWEPGPSDC